MNCKVEKKNAIGIKERDIYNTIDVNDKEERIKDGVLMDTRKNMRFKEQPL